MKVSPLNGFQQALKHAQFKHLPLSVLRRSASLPTAGVLRVAKIPLGVAGVARIGGRQHAEQSV